MVWFEEKNEGPVVFYKRIDDWNEESLYFLSLDYKADSDIREFGVIERKIKLVDGEEENHDDKIFTKAGVNFAPEDHERIAFQTIIAPKKDTDVTAYFYVSSSGNPSSSITNLNILEISQPNLILREVVDKDNEEKQLPLISFKRINPVKYEVDVRESIDDFNLIFLEGFGKNWKAYLKPEDLPNNFFLSKYFFGIFETLGLDEIDESDHLMANGYANSWKIRSDDLADKNYKVIIEYWPQRLFYYGMGIFLLVMIPSVIVFFFRKIFRSKNDR